MRKKIPARVRLLALLVGLSVASGCCALAEDADQAWAPLQTIMDLTASAALRVGETPETIAEGGTLSEGFVYNFFLLGQTVAASQGITPAMLNDTAAQADFLSRVFAAAQPSLQGIISMGESYDYIGVRVMTSDMSEDGSAMRLIGDVYQAAGPLDGMTEEQFSNVSWLDHRAVFEFRKDSAALNGWRLMSFSANDDLSMEDATQTYFTETMVEYLNADLGFSIQYPAAFAESTVKDDQNGISGQMADGSASFYARRAKNDGGYTLESWMKAKQEENAASEVNMNDMTGCGKLTYARQGGGTVNDFYIVTPDWIYEAELSYAETLAKDFSLYSDYMMNSFTADELGIG